MIFSLCYLLIHTWRNWFECGLMKIIFPSFLNSISFSSFLFVTMCWTQGFLTLSRLCRPARSLLSLEQVLWMSLSCHIRSKLAKPSAIWFYLVLAEFIFSFSMQPPLMSPVSHILMNQGCSFQHLCLCLQISP